MFANLPSKNGEKLRTWSPLSESPQKLVVIAHYEAENKFRVTKCKVPKRVTREIFNFLMRIFLK